MNGNGAYSDNKYLIDKGWLYAKFDAIEQAMIDSLKDSEPGKTELIVVDFREKKIISETMI